MQLSLYLPPTHLHALLKSLLSLRPPLSLCRSLSRSFSLDGIMNEKNMFYGNLRWENFSYAIRGNRRGILPSKAQTISLHTDYNTGVKRIRYHTRRAHRRTVISQA